MNATCAHDAFVESGPVALFDPCMQTLKPLLVDTQRQSSGHSDDVVHRFVHANEGLTPQHWPDWQVVPWRHALPMSVYAVLSPHPLLPVPVPASAGAGALHSFGPVFVPPSQPPPASPVQHVPNPLHDFGQACAAVSHRPFVQWRVLTGGPDSHSQYQFGQSSESVHAGASFAGGLGVPGVPSFVPSPVPSPGDPPTGSFGDVDVEEGEGDEESVDEPEGPPVQATIEPTKRAAATKTSEEEANRRVMGGAHEQCPYRTEGLAFARHFAPTREALAPAWRYARQRVPTR